MFDLDFARRILPFDSDAAQQFATITAKIKKFGSPISQIDDQIAAIAFSHNAMLATRNVSDEECGIDVINPWKQK